MSPRSVASPLTPVRHGAGILADPVPVYYQSFAPLDPVRPAATILMLHGGAHSGSCYELTMDGRPGWAYLFARHGFHVVVPDWPGCGRSGALDPDALDAETVVAGLSRLLSSLEGPLVLLAHSMGGALAWRLAERQAGRLAALVGVAPGPPGNIQPVPTILSETDDEIEVETIHRRLRLPKRGTVPNDPAFVRDKLVGDSRHFPAALVDTYAASLLRTPSGLLRQRINIGASQIRVEDPARLAGLPVLVLTGTADLEHPRETDEAIVAWLNGVGARANFIWLGDRGIEGNGHMLMLEENSDRIGAIILEWLAAALP